MRLTAYKTLTATALLSCMMMSGCASSDSYNQAFTNKNVPAGNGHTVNANESRTFKAARIKLVQQGFAIQSMDPTMGVIKATRSIQDNKNKDLTYNISANIDITPSDANSSIVRISASQQSIMHHVYRDYWKLLFIIPLFPTGIHYENAVINEGEVTDQKFYKSFFDGLDSQLAADQVTPPSPPVTAPVSTPSEIAVPATPTPVSEVKPIPVPEIKPPTISTSTDGNISMTTTITTKPVIPSQTTNTVPTSNQSTPEAAPK